MERDGDPSGEGDVDGDADARRDRLAEAWCMGVVGAGDERGGGIRLRGVIDGPAVDGEASAPKPKPETPLGRTPPLKPGEW